MKKKDESYKKIVESLWIEINRAILSSSNVKSSLANLRELGLLKEVSEYNLVVDVNKMVEMMLDKPENDEKPLTPQKSADARDNHHNQDDFFEGLSFEENMSLLDDLEQPKVQEASSKTSRNIRQYIDGKPLSMNQIIFQGYLERQFDMDAWLKKARVRL